MSDFPFKHACPCIAHKRQNLKLFVDNVYTTKKKLMYNEIIDIKNRGSYENIDPPALRRLLGRSRFNRRRSIIKGPSGPRDTRRSNTIKCKNCKQFGYNILGYQSDKTKEQV